jgi:hypothetical protein
MNRKTAISIDTDCSSFIEEKATACHAERSEASLQFLAGW